MKISVDGTQLDVLDEGRGPVLVLLHAFPLAKEVWDAQARDLSRVARVVRLDFRGLGRSAATSGPVLIDVLAGDVASVLDSLGIDRAVVAGHSLGAYVAFSFVRLFAERVAGLGIVCGRADADDAAVRGRRMELAEAVDRAGMAPLVDFYLPRLFAPATYAERPDIVAAVRAICERTDPRGAAAVLRGIGLRVAADDLLTDIDVPVRVMAGTQDAFIPSTAARALAAAIPAAEFDELDCGHMAPLEAAASVTRSLERLLAASTRP